MEQVSQTQILNSQVQKVFQGPVNNFEKVVATKGAPKGNFWFILL